MAMDVEAGLRELSAMSKAEQVSAFQAMPEADVRRIQQAIRAAFPLPNARTRNRIWLIIIIAYVAFMGLATLTLCATVFFPPKSGATSSYTILMIFTTSSGFLTGLLVSSPVGGQES
ncbi:MAG: hypothetical protein U0800_05885 [Isosphaeraceae bacterium]